MKLILLALLVLTVSSYAYSHNNKKKHNKQSIKHHKKVLPSPPSGSGLRNLFGTSTARSTYGPKTLINVKDLLVRNRNGKWNTLTTPYGDSMYHTHNSSLCDITTSTSYNLCAKIDDCSLCAATAECGWC
jgi:hypothetical protein